MNTRTPVGDFTSCYHNKLTTGNPTINLQIKYLFILEKKVTLIVCYFNWDNVLECLMQLMETYAETDIIIAVLQKLNVTANSE